MKSFYFLIVALLITFTVKAQIVNIPDTNFKNALLSANSTTAFVAQDALNQWIAVDINNDGEIQESEALAIYHLSIGNKNISDLTGIDKFVNLKGLYCYQNNLSSLDVSANINLEKLSCYQNDLLSLDVSASVSLKQISCSSNNITNLNFTQNTQLETIISTDMNTLTSIDITNLNLLQTLDLKNTHISNLSLSTNTALENLTCTRAFGLLTSLDVSNNIELKNLVCSQNNITSLDLSNNIHLIKIECQGNVNLTNLVLPTTATELEDLDFSSTAINNVDVSPYTGLKFLTCNSSNLTSLDISANNSLEQVYVANCTNLDDFTTNGSSLTFLNLNNTNINILDLTSNTSLTQLIFSGCNNLTELYIKNGNNSNLSSFGQDFNQYQLQNLGLVCLEDEFSELANKFRYGASQRTDFVVSQYCNIVAGNVKLDLNNDGCDNTDDLLSYMKVIADNGNQITTTFSNENGDFRLYLNQGNFDISTEIPNSFNSNPINYQVTFTEESQKVLDNNFCVSSNPTVFNDMSVSGASTQLPPKPGFDTTYRIIYKNEGNQITSGSVSLTFDTTKLNLVSTSIPISSQTGNTLNFNYTNIAPLHVNYIDIRFNVFAPPVVNINDILNFDLNISTNQDDENLDNNNFNHNVTVVGAFDPNEIGLIRKPIKKRRVSSFMYYRVSFQNEGTADATNIVVKNELSPDIDWSTLQLESASHSVRVAMIEDKKIEFIFNNINLPPKIDGEEESIGYVLYKVKLKDIEQVQVGDIISNQANIFFDYNLGEPTNIDLTPVVEDDTASIVNNEYDKQIRIYPNPTNNIINVVSKTPIKSLELYNSFGKLLLINNSNKISLLNFDKGIYFLKIKKKNVTFLKKIVKK